MAKTTLIIRSHRRNTKGQCSIFVRYLHNDQSSFYATGVVVDPVYWNAKEEIIKKSYPGHTSINALLSKKKLEVTEIQLRLQLQDVEPTVSMVRSEWQKKYRPDQIKAIEQKSFFDYWDEFVVYQREIIRVKDSTLKHYRATRSKLSAFEKYIATTITFSRLDAEFAEQFIFFILHVHKCNNNTAGNRIKHLKVFMNYCVLKEYTSNLKYKKFRKPPNRTDIIALSIEQLDRIVTLDLSGEPRLEKVQHLFILSASTGLRYSDFSRLTFANIRENVIELATEKTDTFVRIPLNAYALDVLRRYPNGLPKISNSNMNRYLKEVGIRAGLFQMIEVTRYRMGIRTKHKVPMYSILTTHLGRRTFVSQGLTRGLKAHEIMRVTGHRSFGSFQRYLHASDQQLVESVNNAWNTLPIAKLKNDPGGA